MVSTEEYVSWICAKIKADIEAELPGSYFSVTAHAVDQWIDNLHVDFIGGNPRREEFKTTEEAVERIAEIIRRTIPNYEVNSWKVTR